MSKKLIFSIVIAIVAALAVGSVAFAANNQPQVPTREGQAARRLVRGLGQITEIGDNQFTVQLLKRGAVTVQVTERTRFFNSDGSEAAFSDLQVGRWVTGAAMRQRGGTLLAVRVLLLPEGFDPTLVDRRAAGEVTAVDLAASTLTLQTRRGESLTFVVTDGTFFLGKVQSLAEVEVGMKAGVGAHTGEDGTLTALTIAARPLPDK